MQTSAKYITKSSQEKRGKMGKIKQQSINSRTDFFYYAFRNVLLVSIPLLIVSSVVLSHLSFHSSATSSSSGVDQIQFSLSSSCTMSSAVDEAHTKEINNGTYHSGVGKTTVTTLCNDGNGYSIYANGYSNNEEGNNKLINSEYPEFSINTGLNTNGSTSAWAMKLNNVENDPTPPVIEQNYNNIYGIVPTFWTKVASRTASTTDMDEGSSFTTTYAVYASSNQHAGTYVGQVMYLLTHPAYPESLHFMQDVADWKDELTEVNSSLRAIDKRDGKLYWVTKLADGNIWMTQNLDLDIGGTNTAPLNSNNTDISTDPSVYVSSGVYSDYTVNDGVYTWNPVSTVITSNTKITYPNNTNSPTVSPAWPTNNYTTPYSAEGGDTYYYTSGNNNNDTRYTSLQACKDASHTEDECKRYFAGNYYNWSAAIASNNSTNLGSDPETIATNSICPKGWRLPNASPVDNINNEFGRMLYYSGITASLSNGNESVGYASGGFDKLRYEPYYFVRSGGISGNSIGNTGVNGDYWSNMVVDGNYAKSLAFYGTNIFPSRNGYRYLGRSIRCVAR